MIRNKRSNYVQQDCNTGFSLGCYLCGKGVDGRARRTISHRFLRVQPHAIRLAETLEDEIRFPDGQSDDEADAEML